MLGIGPWSWEGVGFGLSRVERRRGACLGLGGGDGDSKWDSCSESDEGGGEERLSKLVGSGAGEGGESDWWSEAGSSSECSGSSSVEDRGSLLSSDGAEVSLSEAGIC